MPLPGPGDGRRRLRRDRNRSLAAITHAHQDGCGNTMSLAEGHVSMTKGGAHDGGAINAKGFAFVTSLEDGHGLGWQITGVLMVESSAQVVTMRLPKSQ